MMRSLYAGVSGLRTHQTRMDVIGNNIANVNTTAYKYSSMVFSELMSQTTQKASGPNATTGTGGVNARQIGLGVRGGAININITGQGAAQSTGNPFDIMISGENFFVVNNGVSNYFTRDGSFYVDGAGNLAMTSTGYLVMGWQVDPETGTTRPDTVSALRIMNTVNMTYPAEATTEAYMGGIMDKHDKDVTSRNGRTVNLNFFDARGYSYTAKFVFKQSDNVDEYSVELDKILDSTGAEITTMLDENGNQIPLTEEVMRGLLGSQDTTQKRAGKVSFNTKDYKWDNTKLTDINGKPLVELSDLFDPATKGLKANLDLTGKGTVDKVGVTPAEKYTLQEELDEIAKAYGYEGSTDEFLNLLCYQKKDNPDAAVGGLVDDTSATISIEAMLANRLAAPAATDTKGPNTAIPIPLPGAAVGDEFSFNTMGRRFDGITVKYDSESGNFVGINGQSTQQSTLLKLSSLGGNFSDINLDFSTTSSMDNKGTCTIAATSGDVDGLLGMGRRLGKMIGVAIQDDGMIYASYDNGMTRLLGQIATAAFANASGLEKTGDNLYSATMNSGEFDGVGVNVKANGGKMSSGQLEMSNVDLSQEFTEMITTQRGFQANSRIITVSDTLLEELTNLKR